MLQALSNTSPEDIKFVFFVMITSWSSGYLAGKLMLWLSRFFESLL